VTADIRYARNGGVAIAYQLVGDGETDLAYVPDFVSNLVYGWGSRHWRGFYEQLAQSFRLFLFDKRGTGLSDHGGQFAALETRMEDLHAVLDAAGSSSTVLLASHEGCSMAALYAATYPERTRALALFHPFAYRPEGQSEFWQARLAELRQRWGTQELSDEMLQDTAPVLYADPSEREWFANWLRVGASPAAAYALHRAWIETDLREVLPAVRVPTLVMYRTAGNAERHAREVTDLIPSARALRVSGTDYQQIFLSPEIPEEVARFVAGGAVPEVPDSVLATVLFTDIVGSTRMAVEVGDQRWHELLDRHDRLAKQTVEKHRGIFVKSTGDGILATFDGPGRAVRCALAFGAAAQQMGLFLRAGLHTGEIEVRGQDVGGIAVHAAARVMAQSGANEVLVSRVVTDLVAGAGLKFTERGAFDLKGIPGQWQLFAAAQ
jgi:class 3 adenylate cyclase